MSSEEKSQGLEIYYLYTLLPPDILDYFLVFFYYNQCLTCHVFVPPNGFLSTFQLKTHFLSVTVTHVIASSSGGRGERVCFALPSRPEPPAKRIRCAGPCKVRDHELARKRTNTLGNTKMRKAITESSTTEGRATSAPPLV